MAEYLGGVRQGDLTRQEWEERNAEMLRDYGVGMSDGSYNAYIERITANKESVRQWKVEHKQQTQRFFQAERLGAPHHGQTDETL